MLLSVIFYSNFANSHAKIIMTWIFMGKHAVHVSNVHCGA